MVLLFLLSLKDHETKILGNSTARQTEARQVGVRIEGRRASSSLVLGQGDLESLRDKCSGSVLQRKAGLAASLGR